MKRQYSNQTGSAPSGFTLVEMLVSVTLILLMMTMFAAVFQIATGSVSTQRANSENDQKARALTTIIRADFAKRTSRNLQPYFPGESAATSPTSFGDRTGYFFISTNAAPSGFDDLIQFTISADQVSENTDESRYYGRAVQLVDPINAVASLSASPNQPELDDGELQSNNTGNSSAAEVCYFIRNGNLYRRQMLIREPLPVAGHDLDTQPTSYLGVDFFAGYDDDMDPEGSFHGDFRLPGPDLADTSDDIFLDDFFANFDFSAYPTFPTYGSSTFQTAQFIGLDAFNNEGLSTSGPLIAFGKPAYRFGFNFAEGLSREHLTLVDTSDPTSLAVGFMGRFLQAETSTPNFNYPQQPATNESGATLPGGGDPMDVDAVQFSLNSHGIISTFDGSTGTDGRGGTRTQEDLLLANVHEFRIELWDELAGDWVAPGYGLYDPTGPTVTGVLGDFHVARNLNTAYGVDNRLGGTVFDTWHPDNFGSSQQYQLPPYQPYEVLYPPDLPDGPSPPGTGTGLSAPGSGSSVSYWTPNTQYAVGDIVFPQWAQIISEDPLSVGGGTTGEFDPVIDHITGQGYQFVYRCIAIDDSGDSDGNPGESAAAPPAAWPTTHARRFTENEVTWQAVDNRRSLKAVRLSIKFRNEKSDDMRQLTLMLPLTDE